MANPTDIISCVNLLKTAFPNYQPDIDATCDLWKTIFSDMEGATLKAAIVACLTENRAFAPSVGEIRNAAVKLHVAAVGYKSAIEAYDEVMSMPDTMERVQVVEHPGKDAEIVYTKIKFSHPVIETVARSMGWPGKFSSGNPGTDRAQFTRLYEEELTRISTDATRLPILKKYIDDLRPQLAGKTPVLVSDLTKKLEKK